MGINKDSFNYKFFTKEEVDKQFDKAVSDCRNLTSYDDIIKKIDNAFYNRMFLTQVLKNTTPKFTIYRVTPIYPNIKINDVEAFSYNRECGLGRANLPKKPVFYCAFDAATAIREMKELLKDGDDFYLSVWEFNINKDIFAHSIVINTNTLTGSSFPSDIAKNLVDCFYNGKLFKNLPIKAVNGIKQLFVRLGDLFTLTDRDSYYITSAYAHNILYEAKKKGVDVSMIMYPSVITGHSSINLAIHPNFVDSGMIKLKHVMKLKVKTKHSDKIDCSLTAIGFSKEKNKVLWKNPTKKGLEIAYDDIEINTENGYVFKGKVALGLSINNTTTTVLDIIDENIDNIMQNLPFSVMQRDEISEVYTKEVFQTVYVDFNHGNMVLTLDGWSCIIKIKIDLKYVECYN